MKLYFTDEQKAHERNKIFLEEDDLLLEGEYVEGEGRKYMISGVATIEGERYHEFEVLFELSEDVSEDLESIMNTDWEWYEFNFEV
ncbi:hypothetical protein [Anaerotignum sp. MB30-C6]|uniref:hypothetical protein n=1 Tax=Anaerotignum sp. MB30-C6 TaxID=3070814 RepID=UPI0027DCEF4B|nr:hypothetical protein [Anaerotignum sp. MB30-C6]WMI80172.1 hypothetical protein RBQ60_10025 [Anaerotignum sp. MB30-C6]